MQFIPSPEQQDIIDYVFVHINTEGRKALAIDAKAGTGKTTSILELIKLLKSEGHDIKGKYCAFNADIVEEVQPKLKGTGITAKTFHGLAMGSLIKHLKTKYHTQVPEKFWDMCDTNKYKDLIKSYIEQNPRIGELFEEAASYTEDSSPFDVQKVFINSANKLCHFIRVRLEVWDDLERLNWIILDYQLDDQLLTPELLDIIATMQSTILSQGEEILKQTGVMDFDDMIYWVCKWDIRLWSNKWVFVDEAQDLSPMQRKIVSKVVDHKNGFVIIVGDPNQAIYRFAGADSDSFQRTVNWFKADVLPLTVTRRCDKIIAHHAAELVPNFTALESKDRGKIVWLQEKNFADNARPGDMVICRLKSPLISKAIEVIAKEMPAVILGGNIGTALIEVMEKISKRDGFRWSDPLKAVESYQFVQSRYFLQKEDEAAADTVRDDCDAIKVLLENSKATTLKMFDDYVNDLFSDKDGAGKVIFCTAHKSKGLEASRVFFLKPEKMPLIYPGAHHEAIQQEKNLKYVLMTRAENELVYLTNPDFMKKYEGNNQIPTFVQYDFEEHRWTEDGLYMLDENDMTAIQLPSGNLQAKARPEDEAFAKALIDQNTIPAGSILTFDKESGALMEITVVDNNEESPAPLTIEVETISEEPPITPIADIEKAIAENPLTMEAVADKMYKPVEIETDDSPVEDNSTPIPEKIDTNKLKTEEIPVVEEPPAEPVAWANWVLEHKDKIRVLDTETSNWATAKDCEIVQLGITDLDGNVLFNQRIKPHQAEITTGASKTHGITNDMLTDENHINHYYPEIKKLIEGKYIIAFNSPFDKKALENAFRHADLDNIETLDWLCAMRMYTKHNGNKLFKKGNRKGKGGAKWGLTEAVEQQRITPSEDAHDAIADVLMTVDLIKSMALDDVSRWQNKQGFKKGDIVEVKASKIRLEVIKAMPNGQVNMKHPVDDSRQTMDASAIKLITPVEEIPVFEPATEEFLNSGKGPYTPQPMLVIPAPKKSDTDDAPTEIEVNIIPEKPVEATEPAPKKKIINVTPVPNQPHEHQGLEAVMKRFGSRAKALELLDLLTDVINEMYPE